MLEKSQWFRGGRIALAGCLVALICFFRTVGEVAATESNPVVNTFQVRMYELRGASQFVSDAPGGEFFASFTGTNLPMKSIVAAAAAVQAEYARKGLPQLSVAISPDNITNGLVAMHVFRGGEIPQIVVAGRPYTPSGDLITGPIEKQFPEGSKPATAAPDNAATNAGPKFTVRAYAVAGNTLLSEDVLSGIFVKYTGTNVGVPEILKAASELQTEYRERSFPTVNVTVPAQQITNELVKIQVFEGVLSKIEVVNNKYFSSNNIMRALPSLKPGILLNSRIFQAELDRANANQDRQIYPQIEPGEAEGTTALRLKVEDRLPLHAKLELNNQNSPDTPDLRVNGSAIYNNLWQLEHSLGVQYNFSPEAYKPGDWPFYDQPLVANYSAFYRMPLTSEQPVADAVSSKPGSFGFDEATRRFRLPASSGRTELNFFASRSTIDTGVLTLSERTIADVPGTLSIRELDVQEDITRNVDAGSRLSVPLNLSENFRSGFSLGFDYKEYSLTSSKTNLFIFEFTTINPDGTTNHVRSVNLSKVPTTDRGLDYLPLVLRYDANLKDKWGSTSFGLGIGGNAWYSASVRAITASTKSSGHWLVLNPSITREFVFHTNWVLSLKADGQWASEPLISNEQFSAGGISSVRGYHEGEVFGDEGWHLGIEQKTPPHVVGALNGRTPLTIRGSIYMDYARVYLLDPLGRNDSISLWGAGVGAIISLGAHWESRFLVSVPFERTPTTAPGQPRFDFALTTQF